MPNPITPDDRRLLVELLRSRFTPDDLRQMAALDLDFPDVKFKAGVNFDKPLDAVALGFVELAEQTNRTTDLVRAVRVARPLVPEVVGLADRCGVAPAAAAADPNRVRFAAGQFNGAFAGRRRLLDRLQTYKELHDILHQLQRTHRELARLVGVARQPGYDPLDAGDTPGILSRWLAKTDRDDRRRMWVPAFVRAVKLVAVCLDGKAVPADAVDRELDLLKTLPADEQADLNERLVDTVQDLDTDGLGGPLATLQAALGPADQAEFRARYDQFRANCDALKQLTDEHNLCQSVDGLLVEAAGLMRVPAGAAPQWGEMKRALGQLKADPPPDSPVGRLVRMVGRLADAGPAVKEEWLTNLRVAFDEFFFELDAALLDATDQVLHTAEVLDFRLRGYA